MSENSPCNPRVFNRGTVVAIVYPTLDGNADDIEKWVVRLRKLVRNRRIDWHYVGGRGCVKALGVQDSLAGYLHYIGPPDRHDMQVQI